MIVINRLIGVPQNLGADRDGIDYGIPKLKDLYPNVFNKLITIEIEKRNEEDLKGLKYKNTILETCNKLANSVEKTILENKRPIVIGGDHSIALGSIAGVSKALNEDIGVIWIDAHGDMNTHETTLTGNIHGMPLAALQGLGHEDLVNCHYSGAKIKSENVVVLGTRDLDRLEEDLMIKNEVKYYSYEYVTKVGLSRALEEVKDYLKIKKLHISFDLDVLNPNIAPGVSVPVKDGFKVEEAYDIFNYLFDNFTIPSVDIVEFNPIYDKEDITASYVKELVNLIKNYKSSD